MTPVDPHYRSVIAQLRAVNGDYVNDELLRWYSCSEVFKNAGFATSTSIKKFGPASFAATFSDGATLFTSSADPNSPDNEEIFYMGADPFTIDFWYYRPSGWGSGASTRLTAGTHLSLWGDGSATLGSSSIAAGSVPADEWSFISLTRVVNSGNYWLHINGVPATSIPLSLTFSFVWDWVLMATGLSNGQVSGYIDDFRITKGVARYPVGTYSVPTVGLSSFLPSFPLAVAPVLSDPYNDDIIFQMRSQGGYKNEVDGSVLNNSVGISTDSSAGKVVNGTSSFRLDGDFGTIATVPALASIGTGDITIEGWFYPNNAQNILLFIPEQETGASFEIWGNDELRVRLVSPAGPNMNSSRWIRTPFKKWFYISITRYSTGVAYCHINGILTQSATNANISITGDTFKIRGNGNFDCIRVTAAARYTTANYEIPDLAPAVIPISLSGGVSWTSSMSALGAMYPACSGDINFSLMTVVGAMRVDTFGGVVFNTPSVLGAGSVIPAGTGDVRFNLAYAQGTACGETSGVLFNTLDVSAEGVTGIAMRGAVQFSTPQLDASGVFYLYATGMCLAPSGVVEASAYLGSSAVGDVVFDKQVNGIGVVGTVGYSEVTYPPMIIKSVAGVGGVGFGSVKFDNASVHARAM